MTSESASNDLIVREEAELELAKVLWHKIGHLYHFLTYDSRFAGETYDAFEGGVLQKANPEFQALQNAFLDEYQALFFGRNISRYITAHSAIISETISKGNFTISGTVKGKTVRFREVVVHRRKRTEYFLRKGRIRTFAPSAFEEYLKPEEVDLDPVREMIREEE